MWLLNKWCFCDVCWPDLHIALIMIAHAHQLEASPFCCFAVQEWQPDTGKRGWDWPTKRTEFSECAVVVGWVPSLGAAFSVSPTSSCCVL